MYQLFIANKNYSSWSLRPWVLMTQLQIPFNEQLVDFSSANNYAKFRAFAPNGKVPCLHHQHADGVQVVWESLAIIEYLAERHSAVWPEDTAARAWARCAASEMHAGFSQLRNICPMSVGTRIELHHIAAELQADLARIDELWQQGLQQFGGPFLAGAKFSAVDAFFAPVAFRVQSYGLTLGEAATRYVQQLLVLPVMQQWYQAALRDTWREPAHEQDIQQHGRLIADYRQA